jgi:predicted peptidase
MLKMLKVVALATMALAGLAACNGSTDAAPKLLDKTPGKGFMTKFNSRGKAYAVFVPMHYNPAQKYPMIVFLHGVGEGGTDINKPLSVGIAPFVAKEVNEKGDFDFIVLIAQSESGQWSENSDAANDVISEINAVGKEYAVDTDRVSLTGLSTGGYGTWAIGAKYSQYFAALAPMGSNEACTDAAAAKVLATMNVWCIENFADPFGGFGANGRTISAVEAQGGHPKHTVYPSFMNHNCWEKAYGEGELFAWLRTTSRRSTPASGLPAKTSNDVSAAKGGTALATPY